jgi:hypothetical protein
MLQTWVEAMARDMIEQARNAMETGNQAFEAQDIVQAKISYTSAMMYCGNFERKMNRKVREYEKVAETNGSNLRTLRVELLDRLRPLKEEMLSLEETAILNIASCTFEEADRGTQHDFERVQSRISWVLSRNPNHLKGRQYEAVCNYYLKNFDLALKQFENCQKQKNDMETVIMIELCKSQLQEAKQAPSEEIVENGWVLI